MKPSDILNLLFVNRTDYKNLPIKEKELNFFIVNRYLSKKFPLKAEAMNSKSIDKSLALDMWFLALKNESKNYNWVWNNKKDSDAKKESNKDITLAIEELDLKNIDEYRILSTYYPTELKEELNYIKKVNKLK